jgi:hypothetical protein
MDAKRKSLFLLFRKAHPKGKVEAQLRLAQELANERLDEYISTFIDSISKKKKATV